MINTWLIYLIKVLKLVLGYVESHVLLLLLCASWLKVLDKTWGGLTVLFSTIAGCDLMWRGRRAGPLYHREHITYSVWMAFDLAHIIHYLLIHGPLGFLLFHPFKSILQNPVVRVGWGFLQSGNSSNHLRLSLSVSSSLSHTHTRECFKPALGNKPRSTNLCRDSAKPCLGRNIIKTHLCCHGNRDLNKFISRVCFFTACLAFTWFIGWVEWVAELHAVPIPLLLVARVYLFSYQTSWMIIFHHHSCCSRVQFCLCLFLYL